MLLRVPGLGAQGRRPHLSRRRHARLRLDDLARLRRGARRAPPPFIVTADHRAAGLDRARPAQPARAGRREQLSLFG